MANPLKIVGPSALRQRVFADLCVRDVFFSSPSSEVLHIKTEEVYLTLPPVGRNALELDSGRLVGFDPDTPVWQVRGTLTWERMP